MTCSPHCLRELRTARNHLLCSVGKMTFLVELVKATLKRRKTINERRSTSRTLFIEAEIKKGPSLTYYLSVMQLCSVAVGANFASPYYGYMHCTCGTPSTAALFLPTLLLHRLASMKAVYQHRKAVVKQEEEGCAPLQRTKVVCT